MTSRKSQFRIHKEASRCRNTSRIHGPIHHSSAPLKKRPETRKARQMPPSFPALTCNYKDNNVFTSAHRFYLFAFWFITVCRPPDTWYRSFAEPSLKRVAIIFFVCFQTMNVWIVMKVPFVFTCHHLVQKYLDKLNLFTSIQNDGGRFEEPSLKKSVRSHDRANKRT